MKMKILFVPALFAVAGVCVFSPKNADEPLDNLLLENMEALASGEVGPNVHCAGVGSLDCPINHAKVEFIFRGYSLD